MEGKKNDRPLWINKVFDQFLHVFKLDRDRTVNLRAVINDLEQGRIDPELLKIKVKLAKTLQSTFNNPNKTIGMLPGSKAGDVIWYYKTDDKKKAGVSINPKEISVGKYKEMLMATAEDALDILGYASNEKIESMVLPKKEKPEKKDKTGKRTSKKEDVGKIES